MREDPCSSFALTGRVSHAFVVVASGFAADD